MENDREFNAACDYLQIRIEGYNLMVAVIEATSRILKNTTTLTFSEREQVACDAGLGARERLETILREGE